MNVQKLLRPLRPDLMELLRKLIRTNTVAIPPNGAETPGQLVLHKFLKGHGIRSELYEVSFITRSRTRRKHKDRHYAGRKNLVARLSGSGRGRSLLLNGHMDTVPAGRLPWAASPWSGDLRKGRISGLGSFDMKGGIVAQAGVLCALKAAGVRLGGDIIFESVVDEEWGGGGGTVAARLRGDTADACVISEGTQLEIFRATRGGFVVDLIVDAGDPSAYFSQKEVVSPAIPLGRLLEWIDSWAKQRKNVKKTGPYSKFPDPAPVQVLAVKSGGLEADVPLSTPSSATIRIYFQFLPHENVAAVIRKVRASLKKFAAADPFFRAHRIQWKPVVDPPLLGHELPINHPWTQCMVAGATDVMGKEPVVTAAPYPCDAFLVQREYGIPTLLFGPKGAGAHNSNEYVDARSVMQTAEVLLATALQWCTSK
jgi:acetylornithine deacetylase